MSALFWSAVVNGVIAVPIMVVMMLTATKAEVMGAFVVRGPLLIWGWLSTAVMAVASLAMFVMMAL
jgi:Mn2+/Fe2+ NRAMP family transporter